MKIKHLAISILFLALCSCVDNDYYGLSKEANILSFDIEGQLSNKIEPFVDWEDEGVVKITIPDNYDIGDLNVLAATCTPLAKFKIDPYSIKDFSSNVYFEIMAEDTVIKKRWRIEVEQSEPLKQVPFSAMDKWTIGKNVKGEEIGYKENGVSKKAYFPGNGTDLSWWVTTAEANGYELAGINTMTVNPKPTFSLPQYARLETIWVRSGQASLAQAQVVTGALFVGQFVFNKEYAPIIGSNQPRKMVNIGIPFSFKPTAMRLKMRYKSGEVMRDGKGAEITPANADGRPLRDSCDIYVLLHNRKSDAQGRFIRVGAGSYRTSETVGNMNDDVNGFEELIVPIVYGKPSNSVLAEKPYLKIGGTRGELTFYEYPVDRQSEPVIEIYADDPDDIDVDYISILFSSSAYGDNFWGAVSTPGGVVRGSTLDVKDVELLYE